MTPKLVAIAALIAATQAAADYIEYAEYLNVISIKDGSTELIAILNVGDTNPVSCPGDKYAVVIGAPGNDFAKANLAMLLTAKTINAQVAVGYNDVSCQLTSLQISR